MHSICFQSEGKLIVSPDLYTLKAKYLFCCRLFLNICQRIQFTSERNTFYYFVLGNVNMCSDAKKLQNIENI